VSSSDRMSAAGLLAVLAFFGGCIALVLCRLAPGEVRGGALPAGHPADAEPGEFVRLEGLSAEPMGASGPQSEDPGKTNRMQQPGPGEVGQLLCRFLGGAGHSHVAEVHLVDERGSPAVLTFRTEEGPRPSSLPAPMLYAVSHVLIDGWRSDQSFDSVRIRPDLSGSVDIVVPERHLVHVRAADGSPLAGAWIREDTGRRRLGRSIISSLELQSDVLVTREDGSSVLPPSVRPRDWIVGAAGHAHLCLRTLPEVREAVVRLSKGGSLEVRCEGATPTGLRVLAESGLAGASDEPGVVELGDCGAGVFRAEGLAPGDWRAIAGRPGQVLLEEVLGTVTSRVEAGRDSVATLDLRDQPLSCRVKGVLRVSDAWRDAPTHVVLRKLGALGSAHSRVIMVQEAEDELSFAGDSIPSGTYQAIVYPCQWSQLFTIASHDQALVIVVPEPIDVTVVVTDASSGSGVTSADVVIRIAREPELAAEDVDAGLLWDAGLDPETGRYVVQVPGGLRLEAHATETGFVAEWMPVVQGQDRRAAASVPLFAAGRIRVRAVREGRLDASVQDAVHVTAGGGLYEGRYVVRLANGVGVSPWLRPGQYRVEWRREDGTQIEQPALVNARATSEIELERAGR
jgi:hypothetical protein